MTRAAWLGVAAVLGGAACGDDRPHEDLFTAVSGARLALHWYGYPDGTRQAEPDELYDTAQHTRCRPQRWVDGVVRCVPIADQVVHRDAACTALIGRALTTDEPTHFLDYEEVEDEILPSRVYVAGDEATDVTEFYVEVRGACYGPYFSLPEVEYFAIVGEVAGTDLVPIRETEAGSGRIGLKLRVSDDGMRVPFGVRDRELDADCTPTTHPDGTATCDPVEATPASYFRDPGCAAPVVTVSTFAAPPTIARVLDAGGCARYHAVGAELTVTALFRRDGDACVPANVSPRPRVFALDAPYALPSLTRTVEAVPGRRLQQIILGDGELRFPDERLFDTAMRGDCGRQQLDDVPRCIPAALASSIRLFTPTCVIGAPVAELEQATCERPAFALAADELGLTIHAIGDPVAAPMYHWSANQCTVYAPAPGATLHTLGPAIDPTAFAGAVYFGER